MGSLIFPIFLIISLFFTVIFTNLSEAEAASTVKYKLFFVNSLDEKCTTRNYQAMNFYNDVTKNYLSLYGVSYSASRPECIISDDLSYIDSKLSSENLVIIIPDILFSTEHLLIDSHAWGYYTEIDNFHIIVSSSASFSTKSGSSAWTLTHELAHFILNWQNKPESIFVDWVHNIQDQVTLCKSQTSWDSHYGSMTYCPKTLYKTITVGSKKVDVMQTYQASKSSSKYDASAYSYDTRTILTLNKIPSKAYYGQTITFSGSLKTYDGLPVQGAIIYIKDEDAGSGDEKLAYTTTNSNGMFSVSWYAENTDYWDSTVEIYAVYEGSYEVQKSRTNKYNLSIIE